MRSRISFAIRNISRPWLRAVAAASLLLTLLLVALTLSAGGVSHLPRLFDAESPLVESIAPYLPASWQERILPSFAQEEALSASGVIGVDEIQVASEYGGRILALPVATGQEVTAGEPLVQLDTSLVDARIAAAEAGVVYARSVASQAESGARPGQINVARAQLEQAQVSETVASQAISDTLALVDNPQDVLLQIAVTRGQLAGSEHQVAQAVALKDAAEKAKNAFQDFQDAGAGPRRVLVRSGGLDEIPPEIRDQLAEVSDGSYRLGDFELIISGGHFDLYKWVQINLPLDLHLTPNEWWQSWVGVNAATAQQEGLQAALGQLYAQYNNPLALETKADEAAASQERAEAQIALARAQLDGLESGASQEELDALQARVAEAEAALQSLQAEKEMMTLSAPVDGAVLRLNYTAGEVVAAGVSVLTLADLSQVCLTVYLPETELGRIQIGQEAAVIVDALPDHTFSGQISHIADAAEFTPRNVTTREERATLVYAVEIWLDNGNGLLKAGMTAEVNFAPSTPEEGH